jgi:hypothetical protein
MSCFSFPLKKEKILFVVEACGYVVNPKGCPSPVVNAKRCPSGRHIHQPVCWGEFEGDGGWKAGSFCRLDSMQGGPEFEKVK